MKGRSSRLLRVGARVGTLAVGVLILTLVCVQFAHIIARDLAYARSLHDVEHDVVALEQERIEQEREIRRLRDPRGSIPEIHDLLHLVGDHEAIIYLERHE